ncbi:putative ABC transporter ATP-binding protein [Nostocoides australiense Ben110]|uniref:Putative ABC transporter ATP-binding protein n=1 Tax=Nostocoides australiense Ben110 TaxID=1193182 RepID=W6JYT1_9MICO|nr:ABC transporter ATP-binding protein [Tetrasphaera australiensis]CCH74297.1 putative ABC transporter ATP-binding protein [Tetrasphaera australiensis Ben110]
MNEDVNLGGRGGGRGPQKLDPADRAQLALSPVDPRRILALFAPHRLALAIVVAIIVASSAIALAQPFLVKAVIDDALPHQNVRLLLLAVGGMLAVTVTTALLGVAQTWISTRVGQEVMHRLRTDVFAHLQKQSLGFFTRTRGGEVQSRIIQDIGGMQSVVTSTATSIASNLTTAVGTAIAMAALSWRLSLLSLIVMPPAIWLTRRVALLRKEITAQLQRRLADMHVQVDEGLSVSGVLLTKTLGAGAQATERFTSTSTELVDLELRSQLAGRWRMATMAIIFAIIPALLYLAAGFPATSGGMTIGTLVAFTALQAGLFRPVMGLLNVGVQWVSSMALFSRIFGYLDLVTDVPAPIAPVAVDHHRMRGDVRLDGVSFAYEAGGTPVLHEITLSVPAGSSLALVGDTGSGKSTLASLVARLRDPSAGTVTIDGIDLRTMGEQDLAAIVGVVSQETYLVHDTIRANLLLAKPAAAEAELWQALAAAQVADLVAGLPQGLDTMVGSRGHRFSGGEKQRLAVARTILRNPKVLVLDEATSALDTKTERALQDALDRLAAGRTTITIAHRLSTIRDADQIAVLHHGRVAEIGTHDQLLARGGRYADLLRASEHPAYARAA